MNDQKERRKKRKDKAFEDIVRHDGDSVNEKCQCGHILYDHDIKSNNESIKRGARNGPCEIEGCDCGAFYPADAPKKKFYPREHPVQVLFDQPTLELLDEKRKYRRPSDGKIVSEHRSTFIYNIVKTHFEGADDV